MIWISGLEVCTEMCCCFSVAKSCPTLCNPWTATHPASLSFTVSHSLLKFMLSLWCHQTVSSSALFCFCLQSFPVLGYFPVSWLFISGSRSIRVLDSASVLPVNIQGWFPLGLTGLISLLSRESSPASQFESINSSALSLLYGPTLTSIHDYWKNHSFDYMDLYWQNEVFAF